MANLFDDDWESGPEEDWSGGRASSRRLARGAQIGVSMYELPPDGFAVYHVHHGSEELLVVLRGSPTLRTPEGERQLAEGDVVLFAAGPEGAHGIQNRTDAPIRYLMAGTLVSPEIVEYPDLGQATGQSRHVSQAGEQLFFVHGLTEPVPPDG
jgi:uncharacterized cupin superfamily protein